MPSKSVVLQTKYSNTPGATPSAGSLTVGELAVNIADQKIFVGDTSGNPVLVSGEGGAGVSIHNDLTGRELAECHPLTSIYDAGTQTNLFDILQDKSDLAPADGQYYCQYNSVWVPFDTTPPAAEWGGIEGAILAQTDLVDEFTQNSVDEHITGSWRLAGSTIHEAGDYGFYAGTLNFRLYVRANGNCVVRNATGGSIVGLSNVDDRAALLGSQAVYNNTVGVGQNGVVQSIANGDSFVTQSQLVASLRYLADNPTQAMTEALTFGSVNSTLLDSLADALEAEDFNTQPPGTSGF